MTKVGNQESQLQGSRDLLQFYFIECTITKTKVEKHTWFWVLTCSSDWKNISYASGSFRSFLSSSTLNAIGNWNYEKTELDEVWSYLKHTLTNDKQENKIITLI